MRIRIAVPLFAWLFLLVPHSAFSQSAPAPAETASPQQAALTTAVEAAQKALLQGPQDVALRDQGVLRLPAGFGFVPAFEAGRYLRALGNVPGDTLAGLVVPMGKQGDWFVAVSYVPSGYIKDDDATHWDAAALLESLREGTAEDNKQRAQMGIPPLEIVGWVEPPAYDAGTHRLVWSVASRNKDEAAEADRGINYNTYALGREGYFSLNLVTSQRAVEQDKPAAHALLAALQFDAGKRYGDFDSGTDKVAEYGLAALVAGAAAKKLGLLAGAAVFFAKFWKLLLLGFVGVAAVAKRVFGTRRQGPLP